MFTWFHFFIGILVTALGAVALRYNYQLVGITGRQDWIENKLGAGSTYWVFKLLALTVVVGGVLYATGFGNSVFNFLLSPLRGLFAPIKS